jgi:hypothetical protein
VELKQGGKAATCSHDIASEIIALVGVLLALAIAD